MVLICTWGRRLHKQTHDKGAASTSILPSHNCADTHMCTQTKMYVQQVGPPALATLPTGHMDAAGLGCSSLLLVVAVATCWLLAVAHLTCGTSGSPPARLCPPSL